MTIVFMGTPGFAAVTLRRLLASTHEVRAVVTVPDKPQGRGLRMQASEVKEVALEAGLPVLQPEDLRSPAFLEQLRAFQADVFIVVAFRILPEEVFTMPPHGAINLHGSLLPRFRGAAPIQWAVIRGERTTGVTSFFIRRKVDTGTILLQRETAIGPDMTAGDLHDVLAALGADVVVETLDLLARDALQPRTQDDAAATTAPRIFREMARIDWRLPAADVHNLVRGMNPVPSAWTTHRSATLKVHRTSLLHLHQDSPPGMVTLHDGRLVIACGHDAVEIHEIQLAGSRAMTTDAFLRGYRLADGEMFV